jgi:MEMO1 family protein
MKSAIQPPSMAGRFYPKDPVELRAMVAGFLSAAERRPPGLRVPTIRSHADLEVCAPLTSVSPKAIIAPHAGYMFSGPVAGSAYAQLVPDRKIIKRVVLLGPSHYVSFSGLAISSATGFATPLGVIPVDADANAQLTQFPQISVVEAVFGREHALEVQLPFLQVSLEEFSLIPLLVSNAAAEHVAEVIDALWGGPETRIIVSSDLSHFHDSETAHSLDARTAQAIEKMEPDLIGEGQACGRTVICGLLRAARRRGLLFRTLDLRNSGDTAGPRDRVVGYGAFALQ